MVTIRAATEEDIPRILKLYRQLAITTSQIELSRSPSPDEYRRIFSEICSAPEWARFEPKLLALIENTWRSEQLKIHMHRKQYAEAVAILTQRRNPRLSWDDTGEILVAEKLEKRYPDEILEYYLSGLGNLKVSASRKEYARNAQLMAKVRRVLVEVLAMNSAG